MNFAKQYQNGDIIAIVNYNDGITRNIKIFRHLGLTFACIAASNSPDKLIPVGKEYFAHATIVPKLSILNGFNTEHTNLLASDADLVAVGLKTGTTPMQYTQQNLVDFPKEGYVEPAPVTIDNELVIRLMAYSKKLQNILDARKIPYEGFN
ncbi:hypothetical protein [Flectobacillus longus]|uniref:hypothetical protein n=1 Tax=Flectobacillus longus TaxID=2984207 RepID=UPI0024B8101B|nr:hypothetical protein [Flectobacillus longus]MDI9882450.1 hypothetical protein [Flectobacillus longus]